MLPKFGFIFRNLFPSIPPKILQQISALIQLFCLGLETAKNEGSNIVAKKRARRIVEYYFILSGLFLGESRAVNPLYKFSWGIEQLEMPGPLSEWALSVKSSPFHTTNLIVKVLSMLWKKLHQLLPLSQSPLASITWLPKFQESVQNSSFQDWIDHDLVQFYSLGTGREMYSGAQIIQAIN